MTSLEKLQAINRSQRTPLPFPVYYRYQLDAFDIFMKKVLDCKGGSW